MNWESLYRRLHPPPTHPDGGGKNEGEYFISPRSQKYGLKAVFLPARSLLSGGVLRVLWFVLVW